MTLSVLISCMFQTDHTIVKRTNVQTDCIVVNQCDTDKFEDFSFINNSGNECHVKFISTTERGLSRSRNMAIKYATSDVCLICDDDEVLEDNYEDIILKEYKNNYKASVIILEILREDKSPIGKRRMKMGLKKILQTSSVQITFRRKDIITHNIKFDVLLGSGSGNGAGEENKFLMDVKKRGLKLFYSPVRIGGLLSHTSSQWFTKYDIKYFKNHGWSSRRILGSLLSLVYIFYYVLNKRPLYKNDISIMHALKYELYGWAENRDKVFNL